MPKQQNPADHLYTITDLIDEKKLQEIQDSFAEANGVAATLTDIDGNPLTKPSNHSKVCQLIRATEKGLEKCILSGQLLGQRAMDEKHAVHKQCCSVGFTDAAAPIIVNGKHIANWLIGQYHVGDVDGKRIREFALEIGCNPEEMFQEFERMPKMSIQEFEKKLHFLEIMARELSLVGYQRLIQQQQNEELNQIRKELEIHKSHLEKLVDERTALLQQANTKLAAEIAQSTKMQKKQKRLITAIESAIESIVITNINGEIIYVNPAFEKLTGYSLQEVVGKTPALLKSGAHDDTFYQQLWQTILAGEAWIGRFTNKKKDGSLYQEESTISPVKDVHGKILNFVAVKKDITKELDLERQLHQSQKLESLNVLAAGMAHELNTPIQYVMSNTTFLKDVLSDFVELQGCYDDLGNVVAESGLFTEQLAAITRTVDKLGMEGLKEEADDAISQALEGLNRISAIVSAMKDYATPGNADKRQENLNDLLRNTVEISRGQWKDLAELELDLDTSLPPVPLLADRFKLIFLDMIFNSTHALKEKQNSGSQEKGRITITTKNQDDQVELCLTDTGIGIPKDIIDKVFDPFFTTKQVGQGSGQGLSAAHSLIVENHGGSITVSSVEGKGTEFTIILPLS